MEAVTYLPIEYTTDKTKQRSPKPLVLQSRCKSPEEMATYVLSFFLFALSCCLEESLTYWNKDRMFSDPVERNNRSLPGPVDDILLIESDEEEEYLILFFYKPIYI